MSAVPAVIQSQPTSLLSRVAARYSVEPGKMLNTLKQTAFRQRDGEVSNEQMMALLIVADQHKLNPFLREIYAFPDKNNGVVPVVGVDGWSRIINEHPQFDGMEFVDGPANKDGMPEWIECVMYRKDRQHPTRAREYMAECKRGTQPWQSHPRRMLRHKAMIQCARLAFSFTGIFDEDEAQRITEANIISAPTNAAIESINAEIRPHAAAAITHDSSPFIEQRAPAAEEQVMVGAASQAGQSAQQQAMLSIDEAATAELLADWIAAIQSVDSEEALNDAAVRAEKALRNAPNEVKQELATAIQKAATTMAKMGKK